MAQRTLEEVLNDELSPDKLDKFTPGKLAVYLIQNGIVASEVDFNRLVVEGIQNALVSDDEFPIHYYSKDEPMREEGMAVELGEQLTDEFISDNLT